MNSVTFFQTLYAGLLTPVFAQLQTMTGQVVGVIQPVALGMVALSLAIMGIDMMLGKPSNILREVIISAVFLSFIQTAALYTQYVSNLFLHIIPDGLAPVIGGQATLPAGIDMALNRAALAAFKTYHALPWSLSSIPLGLGIIAFLVLALASCGFTFFFYVVSVVTVVIAVCVGPIFIGLGVTPGTRKWFYGWLGVLVGAVTAEVLTVMVLVLITGSEALMLKQTADQITVGDNSIEMLMSLLELGLLLAFGAFILKRVPGIAHAIGGGVYHGTASLAQLTLGSAAGAGRRAGDAAAAGGRASGRQIGAGAVRARQAAGSNLSSGGARSAANRRT